MAAYMDLIELEDWIFVDLTQINYVLIKESNWNYKVILWFSNWKEIELKNFDSFEEARQYVFDFEKISSEIFVSTRKDWEDKWENPESAPLKDQILWFFIFSLGTLIVLAFVLWLIIIIKILIWIVDKVFWSI